jgi:hypothetical protein
MYNLARNTDILKFSCDAVAQPCKPNGGSPFLYIDHSRVTGPIFTGPYFATYHYRSMASEKPMSDRWLVRRRVDCSGIESSSKEAIKKTLFASRLIILLPHAIILSLFSAIHLIFTLLQSKIIKHHKISMVSLRLKEFGYVRS